MVPENPVEEYLKLTDPTPLTVEILLARGADGEYLEYGSFVKWSGWYVWVDSDSWVWTQYPADREEIPSILVPRTVGELNQLERRMRT